MKEKRKKWTPFTRTYNNGSFEHRDGTPNAPRPGTLSWDDIGRFRDNSRKWHDNSLACIRRQRTEHRDAPMPPEVPLPFLEFPNIQWLDGCEEKFRNKIPIAALMSYRLKQVNHCGSGFLTKKQSNIVCCAFLRGECKWGMICPYSHHSSAVGDGTGKKYFEVSKTVLRPKDFKYCGFPIDYLEQWKDQGFELWISYHHWHECFDSVTGSLGRLDYDPSHP